MRWGSAERVSLMSVYHKKEVGQRIRSLREEKGWTRSNLAEQLDISDRYSSSIELGQKGLSIKTLSRVSEILDATTDYILTGIDMYKDRPEVFDQSGVLAGSLPAGKTSVSGRRLCWNICFHWTRTKQYGSDVKRRWETGGLRDRETA